MLLRVRVLTLANDWQQLDKYLFFYVKVKHLLLSHVFEK